jgi:hypothetical protein
VMSMRVLRRDRLGGLLREYAKLALSDTAFGTRRLAAFPTGE